MLQGTVTGMNMSTEFKQFLQRKFWNYVHLSCDICEWWLFRSGEVQ